MLFLGFLRNHHVILEVLEVKKQDKLLGKLWKPSYCKRARPSGFPAQPMLYSPYQVFLNFSFNYCKSLTFDFFI